MEDKFYNKEVKLSNYIIDIAAGPFGSNLKVDCFIPEGFPIIDGANLKGFKVTDNITKFVTEEKARSLHRSIAKKNDVVVTISGNVGQISYIPFDSIYDEYLVSQRQFRVTFDTTKVYVPYLVYYFHTKEGQYKILSFANQTGVPALSQPLKNFKNIDILLPELNIQKSIASILEKLDSKIELNRRINENLEQQAQALFKSWFVDFEPFKDGKFVDSELGMIPEGWKVKKLGELCDSISVTHPCKEGQLIFLNTGDIENGFVLNHKYMNIKDMPGQAKKSIQENDILYSEIRPINRHFAFVNFPAQEYIVSTKLMVLRANDNESSIRLYQYLTSEDVINELQHEAESRSGTFPQIRFENIKSLKILIGSDDVEKKYTKYIGNIYKMIFQYRKEIMRLAQLRDTLLPRLMSGELAITDVDDRSIFQ